jgi:hypothetical protein
MLLVTPKVMGASTAGMAPGASLRSPES